MQQWIDGWVSFRTCVNQKENRSNLALTQIIKSTASYFSNIFLFLLCPAIRIFVFQSQSIITSAFVVLTIEDISSSVDFFNVSFLFSFVVGFRGAWGLGTEEYSYH
jgi:hypothetical protein